MPGSNLVIVESPAKAKTINKYLGSDYTVLASYGHIRDLPARDGSVRPDEDFAMDWELGDRSKKHLDAIVSAAKQADRVYLATDPDREGEAISWHVMEALRAKKGLKGVDFQRITFNEITRSAVNEAIARPRDLDDALIQAYLARRALDYLVGFTLSPVLWRKLPGSRSAGRVQSVALRLVCERESEIENFRPQEYWSLFVELKTAGGETIAARLTRLDGKKLGKFDIADKDAAEAAKAVLEALSYTVEDVETKQVRRNPAPPFTTSTLQQEASRKLGMGASATMRTAQRLYEGVDLGGETVGLITYMRTDGQQLAAEAIDQARDVIAKGFGDRYVPDKPRLYKTTAKNAQEAHEAIRPTDLSRRPESLAKVLNRDELRLYDLIWKRTVASQMQSALIDQVGIDIAGSPEGSAAAGRSAVVRATGSIVRFDGFLKVYEEGRDDAGEDDDAGKRLPAVESGQRLDRGPVTPEQHFTQPPPRYTEASLVKRLEELGIGRPSTYASILQVLQDREYVRLEKKRFVPEDRGRLVTSFLTSFFRRYVEYDFTARLEEQLDEVSAGRADWKSVLRDFWDAFSSAIEGTRDLTISNVIDALDADLGPHFFRERSDGRDPRQCPRCGQGRLGLKLARQSGAFIGCSNYPDCTYTRPLEVPSGEEDDDQEAAFPRELGTDPETGLTVTVRKGPFGFYVQLGEGGDGEKPKRVSLPKGYEPLGVELPTALALLALPRAVGTNPNTNAEIVAGIGRYGPYLRHEGRYTSLTDDDDVLTVGLNRAMELISTTKAKGRGAAATPLRELGEKAGESYTLHSGRFGPYVKAGKTNATLPKSEDPEALTLERAVEIVEAKRARDGGKGSKTGGGKGGAKAPAKKAPARKASAGIGKDAAGKNGGAAKKAPAAAKKTGTAKTASGTTKKAAGTAKKAGNAKTGKTPAAGKAPGGSGTKAATRAGPGDSA
ncbi:MAG: type I DNA topoisomerase [Azospirillaceae bacterium]